jgi:hypothetical protein
MLRPISIVPGSSVVEAVVLACHTRHARHIGTLGCNLQRRGLVGQRDQRARIFDRHAVSDGGKRIDDELHRTTIT